METCSSILAWEIPWTEEPGGLQSMGLQRVRYTRARACEHTHTRACEHTHTHTHTRARAHTHAHNDANTLPALIFFQGTFLYLKLSVCDLGVPCFRS